jgi:hypothetical protein
MEIIGGESYLPKSSIVKVAIRWYEVLDFHAARRNALCSSRVDLIKSPFSASKCDSLM